MSERLYNLGSPEIQQIFGISNKALDPTEQQKFIRNLVNRWSPSDVPGEYENAFAQQQVLPHELKTLDKYIEFDPQWKTPESIATINKLATIAHANPNPIYSYNLSESSLYRGAKINPNTIPQVGQEFSFDRFRSFTPDPLTAASFAKGNKPFSSFDTEAAKDRDPNKIKTLFQIQQDPAGKYSHLLTPGANEPEVIVRPDARYVVEHQQIFPFNQRGMKGDANIVKLRQIYATDPLGAAVEGGRNLIKQNPTGSLLGASVSLLDPGFAKAVEQNRYGEAAGAFVKDVASGALTEAGIKAVTPIAGRFAPGLARAVAPAARLAGPVAIGAALFGQGRAGSLTDVLTKKAANVVPGLKPNPKTDIGRRASNEFEYILNQLRQLKMPYRTSGI